ncbi:MAG: hypothetical protein BWK79_03515 [Beggiatoa sp. IS2]|nr:MAG: hypothetical protein BWK79_03515 [Beggiatoa sp. IS2]
MKAFKKILFCVDPDLTDVDLVEHVAQIAKANHALVEVLHVIGDYPENMREWWNVHHPEELQAKIVNERQNFINGIIERLKDADVEHVDSALRWSKEGKVFLRIIHEVIVNHHELVIFSSRRRGKKGKMVFAKMMLESPATQLFRYCPCPLWIARGQSTQPFKRVVAALNGKEGKVKCEGINTHIMETATAIAASGDSELHIIHALPIYGGYGWDGSRLRPELVQYTEKLRGEICRKGSIDDDRIHLFVGSPADVVPDFVRADDLLVLGTTAQVGLRQLIVGGTAEKILERVDCGVLAVKPDEFVSLVTVEEDHGALHNPPT